MEDWHPIKVVARRTGLSPHVIRAWEKRYNAVEPRRTDTNRRVYSDQDIARLLLLRRATLAGRSIGQVAELPTEELRKLVEEDEAAQRVAPGTKTPPQKDKTSAAEFFEHSSQAIEDLDPQALNAALGRASVALSRPALIEGVISPLLDHVGDSWRDGSLRVAHEHMASAIIRTFLGNMNGAFPVSWETPSLVVTTPPGQLHELGALLVATTAASEGWRITYLGPNLPADEIAGAVQQSRARAVALSLVYPKDDPHVKDELRRLKKLLPDESVSLLIGGRAAEGYTDVIAEIGAVNVESLEELRSKLESLRTLPTDS